MIFHRIYNKLHRTLQEIVHSAEISLGYRIAPKVDPLSFLNGFENKPRIAFVKQDILPDLYCCPNLSKPKDIIFSTLLRNGPFTLFTKLNADFWMVKLEEDSECQIWKERCFTAQGKQFMSFDQILQTRSKIPVENINSLILPPETFSINSEEVDWNAYDIVITIDIPIPKRITEKYPNTIWCYCLFEPYMVSHKLSSRKIIPGYDLFLNQRSRIFRIMPSTRFHEIDFPYCLQYYGCYHELLNMPLEDTRQGVFIEKHTARVLTENQLEQLHSYGPVHIQEGSTHRMLENLIKSKYFIRVGGNVGMRWSNSIIESVAAGCLFIGNPKEFVNKSFFTPQTCVKSFEELINRLNFYETHPDKYEKQRGYQQQLVNWLCFSRPLQELIHKSLMIRSSRRTKSVFKNN